MKTASIPLAAILLASGSALAQDRPAEFAAPQRIRAGDDYMGAGRLYPSPVIRDMNGDGVPDVVLGDLFGKVTVAVGRQGDALTFGPDEPLKDRDGEELKFHNW